MTQLVLKVLSSLPASSHLIHPQAEEKCAVMTLLHREKMSLAIRILMQVCLTPELRQFPACVPSFYSLPVLCFNLAQVYASPVLATVL